MADTGSAKSKRKASGFVKFMKCYWKTFILILWPIVLLPVFLIQNDKKNRALYLLCVMALFWVCEILPLPITSMIPIAFYPPMGILTTQQVCQQYFSGTVVMFLQGIFIALAIEYSGLHNRIALKVILFVGCTHLRLSFGVFITTMFISMWVSNTAATAMMIPIVTAILEELEANGLIHMYEKREYNEEVSNEDRVPSRTTICYMIGIAYAANVGGVGTLVGTGTNLSLKGVYETRFPDGPSIDFGQWMVVFVPVSVTNTVLTWLYLNWMFLGLGRKSGVDPEIRIQKGGGKEQSKATAKLIHSVVKTKYDELGHMSFHEVIIALLFLLAVFLWLFRSPGFIPGWADVIAKGYMSDASAATLVVILMFAFPATLDFIRSCHPDSSKRPTKQTPAALVWKELHEKTPWGLVFLLGSGFAIAEGNTETGMSIFLGEQFNGAAYLHPVALQFVTSLATSFMTNLSSNVATANIFLPVLAEMAVNIEENPLKLMIPVAICTSHAFLLPIGTPPNAMVSGIANIGAPSFIIVGFIPTLYSLVVTLFYYDTIGAVVYSFEGFPDWAHRNNTNPTSLFEYNY